MQETNTENIVAAFPACRRLLPVGQWEELLAAFAGKPLDLMPALIAEHAALAKACPFLADLARLELAVRHAAEARGEMPSQVNALTVNPSLQVIEVGWQGLASVLPEGAAGAIDHLVPGSEALLVWADPADPQIRCRPVRDEDLLAMKIVLEDIDPREAAGMGQTTLSFIDALLDRAVSRGILLAPPSLVRRDPADFPAWQGDDQELFSASVFTLQWHITQTCDLHCKHCYDRSDRAPMELSRGLAVLDDLYTFCRSRHVHGQVSFSGGNPLLYPDFQALYRAAVDRGFTVAILGNPAPRKQLEELIAVQAPAFFQVSLEGLAEHNDFIRGSGYFQRVLGFLDLLRELEIYSMVMLTLTRDNMDQVLPLAEVLRDRVDLFVFNRLAMVGEGALLHSVPVAGYRDFLAEYVREARENRTMGQKDNLINILRNQAGAELFGGCAGFGCGAAFNFISVLPDGEAHACRKFPSLIGNVFTQSIADVYDGDAARKYRAGCIACRDCPVRPGCGGCLAVSHGFGLDPFTERDPYCFIDS